MSVQIEKPKSKLFRMKDQDPEFESPLSRWMKGNCEKCGDYGKLCTLSTENGVDRMFLCMSAANNEAAPTVDPAQIVADAEAALNGLFPALFNKSAEDGSTPDERPTSAGLGIAKDREV
jgi:hypothetical protein